MRASAHESLRQLLDETAEILDVAATIQGDDDTAATAAAKKFEALYLDWYGRACNVLPEKYQQRFRFEYDGDWARDRIKKFLKNPRARRVDLPGMDESLQALLAARGPWQHPFTDVFYGPFLEQRQLIQEALGDVTSSPTTEALRHLESVFRRLHLAVAVLARQRRDRTPFTIKDEYDLQTLVYALLRLSYEDVREEEPTPSTAGAGSRIDFLLKRERVVVETKHTRPNLTTRNLRKELADDILGYRSHPDTDALLVLIYDPEHRVDNATGFEDDLRRDSDDLLVRVVVVPQ